MQKYIGGFFELEKNTRGNYQYHNESYALTNGRACFTLILQQTKPAKVYVPFYTCDSLLEPLNKLKIEYDFYPISSDFEPKFLPELKKNELFVYINYFGLSSKTVKKLLNKYSDRLVIDNTQAFFEKGYDYGWSFNSARKFFGVPDGGYLYSNHPLNIALQRNENFITYHLKLRLEGRLPEAYKAFQKNEEMQNCDIKMMSRFSEKILSALPYTLIKKKRKQNFALYEQHFQSVNNLKLRIENNTPFSYPLLPPRKIKVAKLHTQNIFTPVLWKDVLNRKNENFKFENTLSKQLLPLPVDHRLDEKDILKVITNIKKLL